VTALEFERLLSASGPTAGHLDRPSDMAIETEIEELEKEVHKLGRQVKAFEDKHGKSSARVLEEVRSGAFDDDESQKWAAAAESLAQAEAKLESMKQRMAVAQPPGNLRLSNVWAPGIFATTASAPPTAACTPSRRP